MMRGEEGGEGCNIEKREMMRKRGVFRKEKGAQHYYHVLLFCGCVA